MADFNPYLEWLGAAEGQRPANHYELLGIAVGEDNPAVIAHAADVLRAKIRRIRPGPHVADWQRLLDDLRKAKRCLLDAPAKMAYDAALRGPSGVEQPAWLGSTQVPPEPADEPPSGPTVPQLSDPGWGTPPTDPPPADPPPQAPPAPPRSPTLPSWAPNSPAASVENPPEPPPVYRKAPPSPPPPPREEPGRREWVRSPAARITGGILVIGLVAAAGVFAYQRFWGEKGGAADQRASGPPSGTLESGRGPTPADATPRTPEPQRTVLPLPGTLRAEPAGLSKPEAFRQAVSDARFALADHDLPTARRRLGEAALLASTPEDRAEIDRLETLSGLLEEFWNQLRQAVA
ncbi:MAG: hypothetical protein ACYTG0_25960, partial [Planctomycetota bacterium]